MCARPTGDAASRTGVARWEEAGLYDPADPGAPERLALLEYLDARGATLEQMVERHRVGTLPGLASELVTQGSVPTVKVSEIAQRAGLPVPLVLRVLMAAGVPAEVDSEVPADLVGLLDAFARGAAIMGDEATLAFTRVLGAAATNVAEAAIALFFAQLGPGTVREGPDELARAQLAEAATEAFAEVPESLARMVMDAFVRAARRAEAARSWLAEYPEGVVEDVGPTEVIALGFVDLVGSTHWARTLNLREQNLALTRFESAAWSSAIRAGGRLVKTIGDEVFFTAPGAEGACEIALEVLAAAADDELLPPARGAVGLGPVIPREGDYFGPLVNLVARLVKVGAPGELVVTEPVASELPRGEWEVRPLEPVELRGIEEPVLGFHVEHRARSGEANG